MAETEEEKKKRWAKAAAFSFMTPSMSHALSMSKQQSSNKYKEKFDKSKAKGYTPVASTPQIEHAKKQSNLVSQSKYKSDFEKNKAKFTSVTDDPETLRVSRVSNQISNIAYHGKGSAVSKSRRRREPAASPKKSRGKPEVTQEIIEDKHQDYKDSHAPPGDEELSQVAAHESDNEQSLGNDDEDKTNGREDDPTTQVDVTMTDNEESGVESKSDYVNGQSENAEEPADLNGQSEDSGNEQMHQSEDGQDYQEHVDQSEVPPADDGSQSEGQEDNGQSDGVEPAPEAAEGGDSQPEASLDDFYASLE